ncbi:MAG: hypothetical protein ABIH39_02720 [Candidatus Margulisiibacteriota bacterium]
MIIDPVDMTPIFEESMKTPVDRIADPREEFLFLFLKEVFKSGKSFAPESNTLLNDNQLIEMQKELVMQAMIRQIVEQQNTGVFETIFEEQEQINGTNNEE